MGNILVSCTACHGRHNGSNHSALNASQTTNDSDDDFMNQNIKDKKETCQAPPSTPILPTSPSNQKICFINKIRSSEWIRRRLREENNSPENASQAGCPEEVVDRSAQDTGLTSTTSFNSRNDKCFTSTIGNSDSVRSIRDEDSTNAEENAIPRQGGGSRGQLSQRDGQCSLHSLPEEILVKVLARHRPVLGLVHNRLVCKRWNELLCAPKLLELHSSTNGPESWTLFYESNHGEAALYNVHVNRWYNLPLDFLPPQFQLANTSARGLLCTSGHIRGTFVVGVCNPLTRLFRRLPRLIHQRYHADVSLMEDPLTGGYQILATGYRVLEMDVTSEIYDSTKDCWTLLEKHPKKRKLARYVHDYPVYQSCSQDGSFYFFINDSDGGYGSGHIVGFDVGQEAWFSLDSPQWNLLRRNLSWNPCLLGRNGCLIMAGGVRGAKNSGCSGVQIWKLTLASREWKEVARMPDPMFKTFHNSVFETFRCFGHGDEILFMSSSGPQMMVFEFSKGLEGGKWRWLENCPLKPKFERIRHGLLTWSFKGLFFTPRLDTFP